MSTCIATTLKGEKCNRKCKEGTFCGYHQKSVTKPQSSLQQSITLSFYNDTNTFSTDMLITLKNHLSDEYTCQLIDLNTILPTFDNRRTEQASVLVIKNYITSDIYNELISIPWDTKVNLKSKVVNRTDKYVMQFSETETQSANYEDTLYTIMKYDNVPLTQAIKNNIISLLNLDELQCNAHYYYNHDKTGTKYQNKLPLHVNIHVGNSLNLNYKWYFGTKAISDEVKITLEDKDLYIMNEKAACTDNTLKKIPILKYNYKN